MAASGDSTLVRDPKHPERATHVELFFDLVFVSILARLTELLYDDLNWVGAYRMLLLLLAVWWIWSYTNLITDTLKSDRPPVQLMVIAIMFGALAMSTGVPDAFEERGLVFVGGYVGIHLFRSIAIGVILRHHKLRNRPLRGIFWFSLSGVPWFAGAFVPGTGRVILWTLALAIDYLAPLLRWPTPRLGRSPEWEWNLASEHLAERYRQFIIIALGETIIITGLTLKGTDFAAHRSVAFALAFITTVLLFWLYFYRTREKLGVTISASADPRRENKWAGYAHLIMVAGVVATTVGDQIIIEQPGGHTPPASVAAILGGPALFLTGRAMLGHEVFAHVARPWLVGLATLAVVSPAMVLVPPVAVSGVVVVVLLGIVLADAASGRERAG
jgi:low temperature requirement protein LtrA